MSYLDTKPKFTRPTGSTLQTWPIFFVLNHDHANALYGLAGLSVLGCLDAPDMLHAGGMTSTGMGTPIPLFLEREL